MRSKLDLPVVVLTPLNCGSSIPLLRRRHASSNWYRVRNDILLTTILHLLTVHARCRTRIVDASAYLVTSLDVYVFDVEGVNVAREETQNRKK